MMSFFKKSKVLVVHNGRFHADDIFAAATIDILLDGNIKIIRTRDQAIIEKADYVADVGGIYDPEKNRFDHHQIGGAGFRQNGIPYAAFGLVWKKFGSLVCGGQEIADKIEFNLVGAIDAGDNAVETFISKSDVLFPYIIQNEFSSFMPTWKENYINTDTGFFECVKIAKKILIREIIQERDFIDAEVQIKKIYDLSENKQLIILDAMYPWENILVDYPEPLVIVASRNGGTWKAETTLVKKGSFERRTYFPKEWAGLRDEKLAEISGVPDAVFCHNGRFIAVAKSKEGALALAQKALENKD